MAGAAAGEVAEIYIVAGDVDGIDGVPLPGWAGRTATMIPTSS